MVIILKNTFSGKKSVGVAPAQKKKQKGKYNTNIILSFKSLTANIKQILKNIYRLILLLNSLGCHFTIFIIHRTENCQDLHWLNNEQLDLFNQLKLNKFEGRMMKSF